MFDELNRLTGWDLKNLPDKDFVLISSSNIDGSFVLHHFISMFVKNDTKVILLNAAQTFSHYNVVCAKLGVNLERSRAAGKLKLINLLEASLSAYLGDDSKFKENTNDLVALQNAFANNSMKDIFSRITPELDDCKSVIVLDDLSLLLNIGFSEKDLTNFVHYMSVLSRTKNSSFITRVSENTVQDDDKPLLYLNCQFYATCEIVVRSLNSGYCKDVHGNIIVTKKKTDGIEKILSVVEMQYKLTDRNLHIFAPGTSKAVL